MGLVETLVLVGHVIVAAAVIGLVLVQHGKGADAGASFGGGASQTVFGSQGSSSFLTRTTSSLAAIFFLTSFGLAIFAKQQASEVQDDGIPVPQVIEVPSMGDNEAGDVLPEEAGVPTDGELSIPDLEPSTSVDDVQPELE